MNIDDRYSTSIWADEKMYVDDAGYRDFITKRIQDDLSKALITALCTKDAIVAIKGDSTTRKDEYTCGVYCRQDIYVKELVQCRDCKFWNRYDDVQVIGSCSRYGDNYNKRETDFCSWGERMDEVKE